MMAVSVLNDSLYAIGGYDGIGDLGQWFSINYELLSIFFHYYFNVQGSCEVYCPTARVWHGISAMQHKRSMAGAVCINNRMYVAGGCEQAQSLNIVEMYNPDTDQWYTTIPMLCMRSGFGLTVLGDQIFAVGGYNGAECLNSMEAFNAKNGTWKLVADMPITRRRFGCCS